ncbi:uncharacterized protein N7446_007597 [Penicillium canescens]|uniref:Integrase catalytic domain-containing protein n=1 Tax=Penicillium canescens TaxID=5083 RepID=A0AAD6I526_PENCN|nr:uncharacterized protein N7446_007597 [Penicillium canescens]KAJ6030953.1 hypothetical protein N7460_010015 [Penicillium canescens]KAJ6063477.1 hypothetical protein N7446_007597 [Penicillium canescens]
MSPVRHTESSSDRPQNPEYPHPNEPPTSLNACFEAPEAAMEARSMPSAVRSDKLKDSSQWRAWYMQIKAFAAQRTVWDLCNPDTDELHRPKALEEPIEPEYPEEGNEKTLKAWRDRLEIYKIKANRWEKQQKGLNEVNDYIITYLDNSLRLSVLIYDTPIGRLAYLKKRFARSYVYEEEVRMKWKAFSSQRPTGDVEKWLFDWNDLREQAINLELDEVKSANKDFLYAIKDVSPVWWQAYHEKIIVKGKSIDTPDLIESFRASYQDAGPNRATPSPSAMKGSFSTWQGHQEARSGTKDVRGGKNGKNETPFDKRPCPCGRKNQKHNAVNCFIVNEAIRPDWFIPNKENLQKVEKTLSADPAWKKWIFEAIENAKTPSNAVQLRSIDTPQPTKIAENMSFASRAFGSHFADSSFKERWILDTGSGVHVCNEKSRFVNLQPCKETLATGDGTTAVLGRGTVRLTGVDPISKQEKTITLSNACYAPGFHVNLVSYARLREKGGFWSESRGYIQDHQGIPIVSLRLWHHDGLWVFDQPNEDIRNSANAVRSSSTPLQEKASADLWHRRLAHIQHKTVHQIQTMVDGVIIEGKEDAYKMCETCQLGRSNRQVSRRPIGRVFGRLGRVHFDLIQLQKAYNKHHWISHFYIEGIRFHWILTHEYKPECQLAINQFVQLAKNWWNLPIKAFNYDNEAAAGRPAERSLTSDGIVVYHSPPRHPEMNGHAERSGGVIVLRMRMLMIEGKLPKELWPEAARAAVWLLNRTPTYLANEKRWIIPWGEVMKEFASTDKTVPRINLSNVRLYGSLAYCRIDKQVQSDKMNPRAEVGFLVGYMASNVWRIWFPQSGKVKLIRDAVFDESRRYMLDFQHFQPIPMPLAKEPKELDQSEAERAFQASISTGSMPEFEIGSTNNEDLDEAETPKTNREVFSAEKQSLSRHQGVYSTPDRQIEATEAITEIPGAFPQEIPLSPTPPYEDPVTGQGVETASEMLANDQSQETQETSIDIVTDSDGDAELQLQAELLIPRELAPRDINSDVNEANIVTGSRRRTARYDNAYSTIEPPAYLHAFAAGLYAEKPIRHHQDDLPELPKHWKDVMNHSFQEGFLAAMRKEIDSLTEKATFDTVDRPKDRGKQILPLRWVFAYKFDQDGYLLKLKARICVRGDLETISSEEKRAATLAARTARMIFALVAAFDLDLRQLDAVTAFLNSRLEKEVYTRMPEGFVTIGKCWKLQKALYGLRISPRLWQQEAARVLMKLGFRQVPEDPCVFIADSIIVFFYVDDILIASHRLARERANQLERDLEAHWELTNHGEAEWFLNIRIIRDRSMKKLWLCQDSYITSVAARYNLTDRPPVSTPLPIEELKSYEGLASAKEIHLYQQKVGSMGYATTITRPDAAKATAKLAQFLTNPGPQHQKAADRVISYLYTTRYLAIEYSAQLDSEIDSVQLASDASYGDHEDRKSSAGYICQVYGGPVDWKATKQRTVTTSTTEAELLGLSEAGKHLQWWRRLLGQVGFDPSHVITIQCDNERAIGLITTEDASYDTKLRHVDIHHLWLRQEIRARRIAVQWVPTANMVADGLTKLLSR